MLFKWGYHGQIAGLQHIPAEGGFMLAGNHVSYLDPPLIGVHSTRQPVYSFARRTLFKRGIGWLFRRLCMVGVDREKSDLATMRRVLQLLKEGHPVMLFPEGTRSPTGVLQRGKKGIGWFIQHANVPVVPVRIFGTFEAWPKQAKWPRLGVRISIVYGKPLVSDDFADCRQAPDVFQAISDRVMQAIANLQDPFHKK